jgi:hypothetical protein
MQAGYVVGDLRARAMCVRASDVQAHRRCAGAQGMCQWGCVGNVIIVKDFSREENYKKKRKNVAQAQPFCSIRSRVCSESGGWRDEKTDRTPLHLAFVVREGGWRFRNEGNASSREGVGGIDRRKSPSILHLERGRGVVVGKLP